MKNIAIIIDPWDKPKLLNKILFFLDHSYRLFQNIKRFIDSRDDIDTVIIASYDNNPIQPSCLKWKPNKQKLFLTNEVDIKEILLQNTIENIYMCGASWDACVQNRPLGYDNLSKIIQTFKLNTNLLVKDDCVIMLNSTGLTLNVFNPEENLDWIATSEKGIYKLSFSANSIQNI